MKTCGGELANAVDQHEKQWLTGRIRCRRNLRRLLQVLRCLLQRFAIADLRLCRMPTGAHRRLAQRLGARGVRVAGQRDILR